MLFFFLFFFCWCLKISHVTLRRGWSLSLGLELWWKSGNPILGEVHRKCGLRKEEWKSSRRGHPTWGQHAGGTVFRRQDSIAIQCGSLRNSFYFNCECGGMHTWVWVSLNAKEGVGTSMVPYLHLPLQIHIPPLSTCLLFFFFFTRSPSSKDWILPWTSTFWLSQQLGGTCKRVKEGGKCGFSWLTPSQ